MKALIILAAIVAALFIAKRLFAGPTLSPQEAAR